MTKTQERLIRGQSLAEMALIFPVLILVLLGGVSFGFSLYEANIASSAIQQPALKKQEMADNPNAISSDIIMDWVTQEGAKGTLVSGKAIDSATFVENPDIALVVGTKQTRNLVGFLPSMNVTVVQALNKNLLLAANGGAARVRPASKGWVPGGDPRTPPWKNPLLGNNVPPDLQVNKNCVSLPVSSTLLEGINDDVGIPRSYLSRVPLNFSSRVRPSVLLQMANEFEAACSGSGAGICEQEAKNLETYPASEQGAELIQKVGTPPNPTTYYYQIKNPPGGPGTILKYSFTCQGNPPQCSSPQQDSVTPNADLGGEHGMYFDPGGKYLKPPDNFVQSCQARKKAECKLQKAVEKAEAILTAYPEVCL